MLPDLPNIIVIARGGIIMGLGMALMEETQFDDRNGRIMNPSLAEYHIPVHMDVPEIEVIWTDIADPHTPMGAHGVGEIGITGVGAAVANASSTRPVGVSASCQSLSPMIAALD
jgi:CO/xanthine dehydrogenase Mo-binding subunit